MNYGNSIALAWDGTGMREPQDANSASCRSATGDTVQGSAGLRGFSQTGSRAIPSYRLKISLPASHRPLSPSPSAGQQSDGTGSEKDEGGRFGDHRCVRESAADGHKVPRVEVNRDERRIKVAVVDARRDRRGHLDGNRVDIIRADRPRPDWRRSPLEVRHQNVRFYPGRQGRINSVGSPINTTSEAEVNPCGARKARVWIHQTHARILTHSVKNDLGLCPDCGGKRPECDECSQRGELTESAM
jgi:hypothetical protein